MVIETSINYDRLMLQLKVAKLRLLDDMEIQLQHLGKKYLDAGEEIPEWVWSDLYMVLVERGELK